MSDDYTHGDNLPDPWGDDIDKPSLLTGHPEDGEPMSDLVERARAVEGVASNGSLISDMADEIERLRAEAKWDLAVKVAQAKRIEELEAELQATTTVGEALLEHSDEVEADNERLRAVQVYAKQLFDLGDPAKQTDDQWHARRILGDALKGG